MIARMTPANGRATATMSVKFVRRKSRIRDQFTCAGSHTSTSNGVASYVDPAGSYQPGPIVGFASATREELLDEEPRRCIETVAEDLFGSNTPSMSRVDLRASRASAIAAPP